MDKVSDGASAFGYWQVHHGLFEFAYTAARESITAAPAQDSNHFHLFGNRAIQVQANDDGTVGLLDEAEGLRWLVYSGPDGGTGTSTIEESSGRTWGSAYIVRPKGMPPRRIFGPTHFRIEAEQDGISLSRTLLCPEGDIPWLLIRVDLSLAANQPSRSINHIEQWRLAPRFLNLFESDNQRDQIAQSITYQVLEADNLIKATEQFAEPKTLPGSPAVLVLTSLGKSGDTSTEVDQTSSVHPILKLISTISLSPGETRSLWFRFGRQSVQPVPDPESLFDQTLASLAQRLPRAISDRVPQVEHEIPWHGAVLTGGACQDHVLGGHLLNQGSAYSIIYGGNAAARDSLQHALPLVYCEPDLALSVLRNTCSWGFPDGRLPFSLTGLRKQVTQLLQPSDLNLWALWLAAEYAAATGDLDAFAKPVAYHPATGAEPVSLRENLIRQFNYFINKVGRGGGNQVRIMNADWNDLAISESGVEPESMIARGGSVLNSAMASWVLSVFAPLLDRLGEGSAANQARAESLDLRQQVASAWNGRWFNRAYTPEGAAIGDQSCWLEVQPWAILCGAIDNASGRELLGYIKAHHCKDSPLGARLIWPTTMGMGNSGGIWPSINMTLIWAASRLDPEFAWQQFQNMSLANHVRHYPTVWEGTLSGPDSWNAPESERPGQTWAWDHMSMQRYPIGNLHTHSQPLLSYLRLLGVEPTAHGTLSVKGGGQFRSTTFSVNENGTGWLQALGQVNLDTARGRLEGRPGTVDF